MSDLDIIRAWKDELYRDALDVHQQALLPPHPAGLVELGDSDLAAAAGGNTEQNLTTGCCHGFTNAGSCGCTWWQNVYTNCGTCDWCQFL